MGERLGEFLARLAPEERQVLELRLARGLSSEETAAAMGSTPDAVLVAQHRALQRLRRMVARGDAVEPPT
jgi:RNA polymerase sigma-70 factor (ECF subfamily)